MAAILRFLLSRGQFDRRSIDKTDRGCSNEREERRMRMDCKQTGAFIASLRKDTGLTQAQLAEKLGVTGGAVSKWERGLCYPDIELVGRLAEIFSVSVNEILAGERLEELTRETADTIVKESVKNYGAEIRKRMSRKTFRVTAGILLMAAVISLAIWLTSRPPSGFSRLSAELVLGESSADTVDALILKTEYDLNGEKRPVLVYIIAKTAPVGLKEVSLMGAPNCPEGQWPMRVSSYCDLKTADHLQVVLTIIVQERDKNYPTTVMEVFDILYRDETYTLTEES